MIQPTTLFACLITLQAGAKTQDKPYVGPKPHPKVQKLLDEGVKEGLSWSKRGVLFEKARKQAVSLRDRCGEGRALYFLAAYSELPTYKVMATYLKAVMVQKGANDLLFEAASYRNLGELCADTKRFLDSAGYFERAFRIVKSLYGVSASDKASLAVPLARAYEDGGSLAKAETIYREASSLWRKSTEPSEACSTDADLARILERLGKHKVAVDTVLNSKAAIMKFPRCQRRSEIRLQIAKCLFDLGMPELGLDGFADLAEDVFDVTALESESGRLLAVNFIMALEAVVKATHHSPSQSDALVDLMQLMRLSSRPSNEVIGDSLGRLCQKLANTSFTNALPRFFAVVENFASRTGSEELRANCLSARGTLNLMVGQYKDSIRFYTDANTITTNDNLRAFNLHQIGAVLLELGDEKEAINCSEKAMQLDGSVASRRLGNGSLGNAYYSLGNLDLARRFSESALESAIEEQDLQAEAVLLSNLFVIACKQKDESATKRYFNRSLTAFLKEGHAGLSLLLANSATREIDLGNPLMTLKLLACSDVASRRATSRTVPVENSDSKIRLSLGVSLFSLDAPSLAVVFAKQSVNITQGLRGNTRGLERGLQDSFTSSVKSRYQLLVDMLLSQGRVPEALTVLSMLKSDEYNQLWKTRSQEKNDQIALTTLEQKWLAEYEKLAEPLGKYGLRQLELEAIEEKERTAEQVKQLNEVSEKVAAAQKELEAYIETHNAETSKLGSTANRIETSESLEKLTKVLKSLPDATAIYTVVTDEGVRSILAKDGVKPFSPDPIKVKKEEFTQMVVEFRQQLENPSVDPRELGAKLYDLLIRPLEKNFTSSKQLLWSLDSVLRYVPIWALYDKESKKFFIEKYPSSLFTPGTIENLATPAESIRTATGLGVSKASAVKEVIGTTINFSELPGAKDELSRLDQVFGVKPLLDAEFDEKSLKAGFGSDLLHVATHFRFQPGSTRDSFLLLGKNQKFTLGEFKNLPEKTLSNVDLLVLSACDTGVGTPNADGSEFEGLALLAQQKGAGAIMASLWPVNDAATSKLMGDFYTFIKNHPEWSKVEALRQAQLRMIRGDNKPGEDWIPPKKGTRDNDSLVTTLPNAKPWPESEPRYKHPYYWAPFVITGNVK
jgi:CHAT domain-containing protein